MAGGKVPPVRPLIPIHNEDDDDSLSSWPGEVYAPPRRRRLGAWIVTICMVAGLALVGLAAERRYHVVALITRQASPQPSVDPRVDSLLVDGERALAEGRLDAAQGDFDKASVLTERDPRVLVGQARVAATKADIPWLKTRLLAADAIEEARTTKAELDERVAVARHAADEAEAAAPRDPRALRAKLDALRLGGDLEAARGYVVAVFAQASEPETAYVLAALDLAQPASPIAAVVDRLRLATASDPPAARAAAALVYALVRSGDASGAKAVLSKLDATARSSPLLPSLHAWVGSDRRLVAPEPTAAPSAAPTSSDSPASAPAQGGAAAPAVEPVRVNGATPQSTLQAAADAMHRGDADRAERIYQAILAGNPNESQALSGLGDVLRTRNDPWGAIDVYKRAIGVNPSYLPALLGLGDTQWAQNDHAGATRTYKRIVDHFPDGTYPDYVTQRAAQSQP
jgi:tetratricopeptide (TPR) repeat protein